MRKQDRIAVRTPEAAVQQSRAEIHRTIEKKGLVSFSDLKKAGQAEIHGGNIKTGVLRSADGESCVIDLDNGRADITGSVNLSGENEQGYLIGSLRPGLLQLVQTNFQGDILRQLQIIESNLILTDPVNGKTLTLKLEEGKGRLSGLDDPEDVSDAVNLSYLRRELDKLREELGLSVG